MSGNKRVFFVTLPNGSFGSAGQSWLSLNIDSISNKIIKLGFEIHKTSIEKILNDYDLKEEDLVIYTSSENKVVRQYVKDVMYLVDKKSNIIPSYDLLMAHENKGFQELYRKDKKIGNLDGFYRFDHEQLPSAYPYVYKSIDGAGSSGVELVRDSSKRDKLIKNKERVNLKRKIISFLRKLKLTKEQFSIYQYNKKSFHGFIVQEFINDLSFDYKILVFWDKFFVLKRNIKAGDFRASGSGLFEFEKPSDEVLEYARDIFSTLDTPYASLDIAVSEGVCKLIEFQALNFGPYTLINAPGYYQLKGSDWHFIEGKSSLEEEFSRSLAAFIKEKYLLDSN